MKLICQFDNGKCSQCGHSMGANVRRKCDPTKPVPAMLKPTKISKLQPIAGDPTPIHKVATEQPTRGCGGCGGGKQNAKKREPKKLGDTLESLLSGIGVTKERYIEAKALFGLPPNCACEARKQWLNKVSDWWSGHQSALGLRK